MEELRTKRCIPEVSVGEEKMSAKLQLHLDDSGQEFTVGDLKDWLRGQDVKTGIMDSAIQEMIEHELYDVSTEIAVGKTPEKGKDGYFIYHVTNPENVSGPSILEDGSVEYVHTTEYTFVDEGDLLAEYVPATFGIYGYTVGNEMRTPTRGKEQPPLRGKGFRVEDGKYYSLLHGKVELTEKGIYITNSLEIKGDLDTNAGNINFDGDVYVRGDVRSGMLIEASGNVEIKGHVGNCTITAGKDIVIQQGMQGKFSGKLIAGGSIFCKFFENSHAEAKGDITVRTVLNSDLTAEGKVIVEGKDSTVLGGSIHAIRGIELVTAGNDMEVNTVLSAGVLQKTIERSKELDSLIDAMEEQLKLLSRALKALEKQSKDFSEEIVERRKKIIQAKVLKSTEYRQLQDEKAAVTALINSGKDAQIIVQKVIWPGCRIGIAGMSIRLRESYKHVKFSIKDGNIEASLLY